MNPISILPLSPRGPSESEPPIDDGGLERVAVAYMRYAIRDLQQAVQSGRLELVQGERDQERFVPTREGDKAMEKMAEFWASETAEEICQAVNMDFATILRWPVAKACEAANV